MKMCQIQTRKLPKCTWATTVSDNIVDFDHKVVLEDFKILVKELCHIPLNMKESIFLLRDKLLNINSH